MRKPSSFARATVLANCAMPITLLAWDAWRGELGANPVNFAIRTTGILSLIFLLLTLAVTPVSRLTGRSWLGQFRRMMGLCAFFHAAIHFGLFFAFDRNGLVGDTLSEIVKRPYLLVGTTALVLMVPLAATSTDGMIRRLGGHRWKRLHRLTYLIAAAGALHFYMLVKADTTRPLAFAGVLGILLGSRLVLRSLRRRSDALIRRPGATAASSPSSGPRFWKGQLRVARVIEETPNVRTFRLVAPDGSRLPFDHEPGQYLNLSLRVDGRPLNRSYTIASPPSRVDCCEITVKREDRGRSSGHLHDLVREGDLLEVSAPAGRFTFRGTEADSIVLIAGGVGITPLMAKIRYLTDQGWPGRIDLVFAARTERDIIFRDELETLARRFPNLHVTTILSGEAGAGWTGHRGRITAEFLSRVVPGIEGRRIHLCGPGAMMDAVREILRDLGVPEDQVRTESFVRPVVSAEPSAGSVPGHSLDGEAGGSIAFARSGKSGPIPATQTVLEAAEALGVEIPYDCRAGICGQCRTRLVSGEVVMETEDALSHLDRAAGLILACQARCLGAVVVDA